MRTRRRSLLARSLMLYGPHTLNWSEDMLPLVDPHHLVIESIAGAVSIGTELPQYLGTARSAETINYPKMTGYESYGRITSVGQQVPEQLIGEKVLAHYGHRTHAILPLQDVILVPSRVPPPTALLAILTCDVAKGVRKLHIQPDERVLVTGAGAIGLMTVWLLKQYGVQSIHVLEIDAERCEKAIELGANVAVHPAEAQTWQADFDIGIECSSSNDVFAVMQAKMTQHGRICVLSDGNREALTLSPHFHQRELTITASSDGWDYQRHAIWFWQMIASGNLLADLIFDLTIPHTDLPQIFANLARQTINPTKILVNYQVENW